jgi:uncharacterized membrane protein YccC
MEENRKKLLLYIAKCLAAVVVIGTFSVLTQYSETVWALISAVLVLSPDDQEALPLAVTRIEANLLGSVSALLCMLPQFQTVVTICLAFTLSIVICYLFRLMPASRSALAAVTIVVMAPSTEGELWDKPVARMISVTAGCLVGLIITLAVHRRLPRAKRDHIDHTE